MSEFIGNNQYTTLSDEERFWQKVVRFSDDECWDWLAYKSPQGYGRATYRGKLELAHRVSWMIHFGEIPDGFQVLHHCDNPPCSNPKHLFLGTNDDNVRDKMEKGRFKPNLGMENGSSKLSPNDVIEIRQLYDSDILVDDIAKRFDVERSQIIRIGKRISWRHIRDNKIKDRKNRIILSEEDVRYMRENYYPRNKNTREKFAEMFNITEGTVQNILYNCRWKNI